jgi:hypothetical protein
MQKAGKKKGKKQQQQVALVGTGRHLDMALKITQSRFVFFFIFFFWIHDSCRLLIAP